MPLQLDIEQPDQLLAYLREHGHIAEAEQPQVTTLAGGVSNKTVLVEFGDGTGWVVKQALPKLRVAVEWFSDPARIHREALAIRELAPLLPTGAIPPLVFEDEANYLLAMEAVPQPHTNWKHMLLAGNVQPDHVRQFGTMLGQIHARTADLHDHLMPLFGDRSFFETLRLEPFYAYPAETLPEVAPFAHALIKETRARQTALVHGDYSPKNILVREGRLILLDHEVAHMGDPMFDVGFALAHLMSKANHLLHARAALVDAANLVWRSYVSEAGALVTKEDERRAARHLTACILARVAGRSPVDYLTPAERERQKNAALALIADTPTTVPDLVEAFIEEVTH